MEKKCLLIFYLIINYSYSAISQEVTYGELANRTHQALENEFNYPLDTNNFYKEKNIKSNSNFHYWWNAHALDLLIDAFIRSDDSSYIQKVTSLVHGMKDKNGGTLENEFNDDMEWMALALHRAYLHTNDTFFLDISSDLWDKVKESENSNQGGGIAWKTTQLDYKNTPANAPAVILAARLYEQRKIEEDIEIARRLYNWLKATLTESSGRVNDGINRTGDGSIDYWQFTYNYGTFIGAALEMYNVTDSLSYFDDAILTADYVMDNPELIVGGILKDEGGGDGGLFKGILVRYLTLLIEHEDVPLQKKQSYSQLLENCANSIYHFGINQELKLIGTDWNHAPTNNVELSAHLSGMMMIEAAHRLNFTPQEYEAKAVPGILEAEEYFSAGGIITENTSDIGQGENIGSIDANDWLRYYIDVSESGEYVVNFRVSCLTGGSQLKLMSSGELIKAVDIPSTGDWQNWTTVSEVIHLSKGKHFIEIHTSFGGFNLNWLEFSKEQSLAIRSTTKEVFAYPNPVDNGGPLFLVLGAYYDEVQIAIVDISGIERYTKHIYNHTDRIRVEFENLEKGIYYARIKTFNSTRVFKFIIK